MRLSFRLRATPTNATVPTHCLSRVTQRRQTWLSAACASLVLSLGVSSAQAQPATSKKKNGTNQATGAQGTAADKPSGAQDAPSGNSGSAAAALVQRFYDQSKAIEADFVQVFTHAVYQRSDTSQGRVVFAKPGKMRWDYAKPAGKVIVADGDKLLMYEPGDEGDAGYFVRQKLSEAQLSVALGFLVGTGNLTTDFDVTHLKQAEAKYPEGNVLDLRPKQANPYFERLVLYTLNQPTAGVIQRIVVIDASGNRNRFDFKLKTLKFDHAVPQQRFNFKPPKGARLVNP